MFTPKNIEAALVDLFEKCNPEDMAYMLENFDEEFDDIDPKALALIFDEKADMVYDYHLLSVADEAVECCGNAILPRRAVRLMSNINKVSENDTIAIFQCRELWLMENMKFAEIQNVALLVKENDKTTCVTEYRHFIKTINQADDVFFDASDLVCELDDMYMDALLELEATIDEP